MVADYILFFVLAAVAVVTGLGMLFSPNAIYSALNLVLNFGAVAVMYLMLEAPFIALAQITVYAGAILVLFLFVIMLLGAERLRRKTTLTYQQPLAMLLVVILVGSALYVLIFRGGNLPAMEQVPTGYGSAESIGSLLFSAYLLPFEVTSILLLVAMVGAIVLTLKRRQKVVR